MKYLGGWDEIKKDTELVPLYILGDAIYGLTILLAGTSYACLFLSYQLLPS